MKTKAKMPRTITNALKTRFVSILYFERRLVRYNTGVYDVYYILDNTDRPSLYTGKSEAKAVAALLGGGE